MVQKVGSMEINSTEGDRPSAVLPTILRYVVAHSTRPHVTRALPVCEHLRTALIQLSDGMSVFSGHDVDGSALQGNQHAYIFAEPDEDGNIGYLTLYRRKGFTAEAQYAAQKLERLWSKAQPDILLILNQRGFSAQIGGHNFAAGQSPQLGVSRIWESVTPFVPVRHAKTNKRGEPKLDGSGLQIGSPIHDLIRLAKQQKLPPILAVTPIEPCAADGRSFSWQNFITDSYSGGVRGRRHGSGYRIEFSEPIHGPLLLGFAKHRGLGAFTSVPPTYKLQRGHAYDL